MVLLRHLLGDVLRRLRLRQGRTLREVSAAARVSLGYLSEVERGQKEASSELLAAICTALNTPLSQVLREVSDNFALAELQNEPVLAPAGAPAQGRPRSGRCPLDQPGRARAAAAGVPGVLRRAAAREAPGARLGMSGAWTPSRSSDPVGVNEDHPAFDEVTRRVRDLSDMVPV